VARLVLELQQPVWASGRVETVLRWMEWLRDVTAAEHFGAIAVHGYLIFGLLGQPSEAERWRQPSIDQMRRDARIARDGLSPGSPYRVTMLYTEGVSYLLQGDPAQAGPILARAFDDATRAGAQPLAALILAERCNVAAECDNWAEAAALARDAVTIVQAGRLDGYWTSALVYAWATRAALHEGNIARARQYLGRAALLRPLLTYALPVVSVQALIELARSYLALADQAGAAAVLRQADDILQQRPDLGVLPGQADGLQSQLAKITASGAGASSLTAAELRLLPLLATHLSFRRSASGSTSRPTRSRPRPTPPTGSSGSRHAAKRSRRTRTRSGRALRGRSAGCTVSVRPGIRTFIPIA
jgi:LuxR family transcriptional regulator, maltose regulon positive regulatory protein